MRDDELAATIVDVDRAGDAGDGEIVVLRTDRGDIDCRLHAPRVEDGVDGAAVWIAGAGGGLDGPASRLYPAMARRLVAARIASLRVAYRSPGRLDECALDAVIGAWWLGEMFGVRRIAVVGHSFGGAVAIAAGGASPVVTAVAAMSSQTAGTAGIARLRDRPLLLIHGTRDDILPDRCSRWLASRAPGPVTLRLHPCGHGLDACRDAVVADLERWLRDVLAPTPI